jgi:hypothetical protein
LSIPLYVHGKAVSKVKGVYPADSLKPAVMAWEEGSRNLKKNIEMLFLSLR